MVESQQCSFPGCKVKSSELLYEISTDSHLYILCPLHLPYFWDKRNLSLLTVKPNKNTKYKCVLCDSIECTLQYHVKKNNFNVRISLCYSHLAKLLQKKLSRSEYFILKEKFGEFHEISSEYYDKRGISKNK